MDGARPCGTSTRQGALGAPGRFRRHRRVARRHAARVLSTRRGSGACSPSSSTRSARRRAIRATRVITVAYYALVEPTALERAVGARHAGDLRLVRLAVPWAGETGGPVDALDERGAPLPLAFDHAELLGMAVKRLRGKLDYAPIGFELLPADFSLRDLRLVHEAVLGRALNKDTFRRRILDRGLVVATGERAADVGHRPPELYRFADLSAT